MVEIAATERTGLFHPRRLGHVNFWVNGFEEIAAFYTDVVGVAEVYRREAIKAIFMSNGNTYHDLAFMDLSSSRGVGKIVGLHHFSLELESEKALVDGFMASKVAGYDFDFTISADVANSAYGSDPDGNRFEVYADIKPNWREERSGAVSSGGKPWTPGEDTPRTESFYPQDPPIVVLKDSVFHPRRVSHAVLVARDYEAMVHHYTWLAGLKPLTGGGDAGFIVLGGALGEETLTLVRDRGFRAPGLHHFGMEIATESELDASKQKLAQRGIGPFYEVDHPTRRSLFLTDPAGQKIQFYVNRKIDYDAWNDLEEDVLLQVA